MGEGRGALQNRTVGLTFTAASNDDELQRSTEAERAVRSTSASAVDIALRRRHGNTLATAAEAAATAVQPLTTSVQFLSSIKYTLMLSVTSVIYRLRNDTAPVSGLSPGNPAQTRTVYISLLFAIDMQCTRFKLKKNGTDYMEYSYQTLEHMRTPK